MEVRQQLAEDGRRVLLNAVVYAALARCGRLGIGHADFYRAFIDEQTEHPTVTLSELVELTFRRLAAGNN
jgi:hypothetical protein